jgi:hypothetical protein
MLVPKNAIAETVDNLKKDNENSSFQIDVFTKLIKTNEATIKELEPLGVWEEVPDETPVGPPIEAGI